MITEEEFKLLDNIFNLYFRYHVPSDPFIPRNKPQHANGKAFYRQQMHLGLKWLPFYIWVVKYINYNFKLRNKLGNK